MAKVFTYRGKTAEEIAKLDLAAYAELVPARVRRFIKRALKRGWTREEKALLKKIAAMREGKRTKLIKTHCREMPILPIMFGLKIAVHNGKEFVPIQITPEMVGTRLGDYVLNCKEVKHGGPGIGATRGSKFLSVK
ncbi:MAG: 30S ribosomal protein S19 [Candidatus Nanoarchaeia archaeon]